MQHNATKYSALARTEEMPGHDAPAIFFTLLHSAQVLIAVTLKLCTGQPPKSKDCRPVSLYLMNP